MGQDGLLPHRLECHQRLLGMHAFVAGAYERSASPGRGENGMPLHCLKDLLGSVRTLTLFADSEKYIVRDCARQQVLPRHRLDNFHGPVGLRALLAGTEQGMVCD